MPEYLDREQALSFPFANGQYDHEHADPHFILGCESYKEWLENLPRADVVPVGEWIAPNEFFNPKAYRKCSLCGMHFDIYPPYKAFDGRICYPAVRVCNYCPNCGAKMGQKWER